MISRIAISRLVNLVKTVFRKEFLTLRRYPLSVASQLLVPLTTIIPVVLLGATFSENGQVPGFAEYVGSSEYQAFLIFGALLLLFNEAMLFNPSRFVRNEMLLGTLEQLWVSPTRIKIVVSCNSLFGIGLILAAYGCTFLLASAIFRFDIVVLNLGLLALFLVLNVLLFYGIGLIFAGMVLLWRQTKIPFLLNSIFYLFSGATYSLEILPTPLKTISFCLPYTYSVDLFRAILMGTRPLIPLGYEILVIFCWTVMSLLLGNYIFNLMVRKVYQRGTVGQY